MKKPLLLILASALGLVSTLLWARLDSPYIWIILFVTYGFALIGFADSGARLRGLSERRDGRGHPARHPGGLPLDRACQTLHDQRHGDRPGQDDPHHRGLDPHCRSIVVPGNVKAGDLPKLRDLGFATEQIDVAGATHPGNVLLCAALVELPAGSEKEKNPSPFGGRI